MPRQAESQTLLSATITTAVSASVSTPIVLGIIPRALTLLFVFTYGSSGTSAKFWVQTSLDGGATWIDIACLSVTTSSLSNVANLSATTPVTTLYVPTDGTLTDNTVKDGILGDRFRVKRTTTGTYAGATTVAITILARA
jgi:hypothetical protein